MKDSTKIIIGVVILIVIGVIVWLIIGIGNTNTGTASAGNKTSTTSASTGIVNTVSDLITGGGSSDAGFLGYSKEGRPLFTKLGDTQADVYSQTKPV